MRNQIPIGQTSLSTNLETENTRQNEFATSVVLLFSIERHGRILCSPSAAFSLSRVSFHYIATFRFLLL